MDFRPISTIRRNLTAEIERLNSEKRNLKEPLNKYVKPISHILFMNGNSYHRNLIRILRTSYRRLFLANKMNQTITVNHCDKIFCLFSRAQFNLERFSNNGLYLKSNSILFTKRREYTAWLIKGNYEKSKLKWALGKKYGQNISQWLKIIGWNLY